MSLSAQTHLRKTRFITRTVAIHDFTRSCTSSLRIIQSTEKQVTFLRFTDRGGGTRDGARLAVPHTFAAWHPGALCKPTLGLATAPRDDQPRHHAGHEAFTCEPAISRSHP